MLKEKIYGFVSRVVNGFSYIIPKSPKIWIYGAWSGKNYSDNPKYMFEYMCENHPEIKSIWITRESTVQNRIRKMGRLCYKRFSVLGLYYTLRAGVAFETAGNEDISLFINNKLTKTIMMWHGVGGKSSKWKNGHYGITTKFRYDYFPASSDLYIKMMSKSKNVPESRFRITGQARDDAFVNRRLFKRLETIKEKNPNAKLIIYMPTHRNFGRHENNISIDEMNKVDSFLKANNMIMFFKPHFNELKFYMDFEKQFTNIIIAKEDEWSDPYEYLHYFDLMVGDYSSVMYDYLCLDKPIVLYTYDIKDFIENDANLDESFWELPIGPMCNTWDEVFTEIKEAFLQDTWKDKRHLCCKAFHDFNDGNNCQRTYLWVKELLNINN